ncbi:MAG: hypothetical protein H7Z42_05140 [Roseiflexaceae bacterium]|nr:hypothetical protein [Roseiflexaceae bacterium]
MKQYQTELRLYFFPWRAKKKLLDVGFPQDKITEIMPIIWTSFFFSIAVYVLLGFLVWFAIKGIFHEVHSG